MPSGLEASVDALEEAWEQGQAAIASAVNSLLARKQISARVDARQTHEGVSLRIAWIDFLNVLEGVRPYWKGIFGNSLLPKDELPIWTLGSVTGVGKARFFVLGGNSSPED